MRERAKAGSLLPAFDLTGQRALSSHSGRARHIPSRARGVIIRPALRNVQSCLVWRQNRRLPESPLFRSARSDVRVSLLFQGKNALALHCQFWPRIYSSRVSIDKKSLFPAACLVVAVAAVALATSPPAGTSGARGPASRFGYDRSAPLEAAWGRTTVSHAIAHQDLKFSAAKRARVAAYFVHPLAGAPWPLVLWTPGRGEGRGQELGDADALAATALPRSWSIRRPQRSSPATRRRIWRSSRATSSDDAAPSTSH